MALAAGTRFGPYEIGDSVGAGGMGEVYRATDTTLERQVAVKVLPASFAADADRIARFDREAKTLASLNHPNIAQIFGLEKSDGTTALVMELVEGPTLADRIADGPLPADESLGIAMQIADALEAAHGQNIVHRDLKPANIKVRPDGTVKVLDFGIAKALQPDALRSEPRSPMLTTPATQVGVILGTAAYMSPEQAKGKPVDERTDIWAFGCVLYEMLTGQMAFGAEDVPTTLARVIANDTDLKSLPAAVSPAVRHTIKLCLEKDLRKRVRDIGDVKLALTGAFEPTEYASAYTAAVRQPLLRRPLPIAIAALIVGGGVAGFAVWLGTQPEPLPLDRFAYSVPEGQQFRRLGRRLVSVSPDGRAFVYNTQDGVYLRRMEELEARVIPGTEEDLDAPFFSPDGQMLAYWAGSGQLKRIALSGGAPVVIASGVSNVFGASWAHDDTILYGQPAGIYRVPAAGGGDPELIIPRDSGSDIFYGPQLLPDGASVLFTVSDGTQVDDGQIVVESLVTGERRVLVSGGSDARYFPTGHVIYALENGLFGIAFDADSLMTFGGPVSLVQGVSQASAAQTGVAHYEVSDEGTLVYVSGGTQGRRALYWVDRQGREERLDIEPANHGEFRLSPGGGRAATRTTTDGSLDIWIYDLARGVATRLTFDPANEGAPVWTPDGRRVAYGSADGISWMAADGTGQPENLVSAPSGTMDPSLWPDAFSPDGSRLVYEQGGQGWDLHVFDLETGVSESLIEFEGDQEFAALSPDGRWIAYESNETGRGEIFVRPFPDVDSGRWQISRAGGRDPVWSPDSRELFFRGTDVLHVVSIDTDPVFSAGIPTDLFPTSAYSPQTLTYAVSADGERFLMMKDVEAEGGAVRPQIVIVQNWFEELKRLVPTE